MKIVLFLYGIFWVTCVNSQNTPKPKHYSELDSAKKSRIDSLIYSRIRFNASKAENDIQNDTIRIIWLTREGWLNGTNGDLQRIEHQFEVEFYYEYMQLPHEHLQLKQEEYNHIVFRHLDSVFHIDTKKEIQSELVRQIWEKFIVSNHTDKELQELIRTTLKREGKSIKKKVFDIDCLYRDRRFEEALNGYYQISRLNIQNQTMDYVINSIYHCYLNLQQYEKANDFKKKNSDRIKYVKK